MEKVVIYCTAGCKMEDSDLIVAAATPLSCKLWIRHPLWKHVCATHDPTEEGVAKEVKENPTPFSLVYVLHCFGQLCVNADRIGTLSYHHESAMAWLLSPNKTKWKKMNE